MKRKPTKTNRLKLACQLAQLFARLTETDSNGYGRCVSCGKYLSWNESQGGHWHPKGRNYNAACIDPRNIHLQDSRCNLYLQGNTAPYTQWMLENVGQKGMDEIAALSHQLLDMIYVEAEFIPLMRERCRELAKNKNFKVNIP